MKHSTDNSGKAVNGETLSSIGFRQIEKILYGLVCCLCCLIIVTASGGCDLGTPVSGLRGLLETAPPLEEYDDFGTYLPYKTTGEMYQPRYLHVAHTNSGGLVFVVGGSDESGLSALDTIEVYDQAARDQDAPIVDTDTGLWFDTDIEGNPITMQLPRILHTVSELPNGILLIIGGSVNIQGGVIVGVAEKFDTNTRLATPLEEPMVWPRFRHQTTKLPNGVLMITGGQVLEQASTSNLVGFDQAGNPVQNQQLESFYPSTREIEYYYARDEAFLPMFVRTTNEPPARLASARGRSSHCVGRFAAGDMELGGNDDLLLITGGLMTLSAQTLFAPQTKFPGLFNSDGMTSIEVFDAGLNISSHIASVALLSTRIGDVSAVNLGKYNDYTPDGFKGMGNLLLITHGNIGADCEMTPLLDQVLFASFNPSGSGPARGIQFYEIEEDQFLTHIQNMEYPGLLAPTRGEQVARTGTNPIILPHEFPEALHPLLEKQGWVFSLAGVDIFPVPGGCAYNFVSEAMLAGSVFDPFFNIPGFFVNNVDPRDLSNERFINNLNNPLGVVGAWFTIDGEIPPPGDPADANITEEMTDWGLTPVSRWPENLARTRVLTTAVQIAGVDGVLHTYDDRILLTGGGESFPLGGAPSSPSAEVFLPPGSSAFNPD